MQRRKAHIIVSVFVLLVLHPFLWHRLDVQSSAHHDDAPKAHVRSLDGRRAGVPSRPQSAHPPNNSTARHAPIVIDEVGMKKRHSIYNNYYKHNATEKGKLDIPKVLPWSLPDAPSTMKSSNEFMEELIDLKHKNGMTLPWDNKQKISTEKRGRIWSVQLAEPVIVLNLPKSGTTSLQHFLECGKLSATHTFTEYAYETLPPDKNIRIGDCMRNNFIADNSTDDMNFPPFHRCDGRVSILRKKFVRYVGFSDIGVTSPGICFYSTLHDGGLEHIAKHYPNATLIYMTRDTNSWYHSALKWHGMLTRWISMCGFGPKRSEKNQTYWTSFYNAHTEKIRRFAMTHLSMTYIELELGNDAAAKLEHYTGIASDCLMHCLPQQKKGCNKGSN